MGRHCVANVAQSLPACRAWQMMMEVDLTWGRYRVPCAKY
jgi:hypothetical protein